ncbi:capsid assembly protein [Sphingomonas sp.]|uniref:capsid assembly protein n=1 Tax=Sphingomonas sp. TaxID=28214 RepID=UPI002ED7B1A6
MTDTTNTPTEEPQGLSEAEQRSVEIGQRGISDAPDVLAPPQNGPQRPDWCPEQFWKDGQVDNEGLAKSYGSLRAKMDGGQQPDSGAPQQQQQPADAAKATGEGGKIEKPKADEAQPHAALHTAMEAARVEFATNKAVSDETVASLEAAGIPKEIFDVYLAGVQALSQQQTAQMFEYVGGEATYNEMTAWAAQNLSDAEIEAFNTAIDNPQLRETAVKGLYARFGAKRPAEGKLVTPNDGGATSGDVYNTREELIRDQRDPRYQTDATFRQGVMDKLKRSQRSGFTVVARSPLS